MENWGLLFVPVGIFLFMGIVFWIVGHSFSKRFEGWIQTTGRIVDSVTEGTDSKPRPVIEFETKEGLFYEVVLESSQRFRLPIGVKVPVVYNAEDPTRARIDLIIRGGRLFKFIGTALLVLSAVIFVVMLFIFK